MSQPSGNAISTEYLSHDVLMVINKSVDPMLASHIDQFLHHIQIGLIVMVLLRLHTRPHHTQTDTVETILSAVGHVLL